MRLINAADILEKLSVFNGHTNGNEHFLNGIETAVELIEQMQTVDAVPVIRCKECKWCVEDYYTYENVPYWVCVNFDIKTDADGYCHEAERKKE